VLCPFGSVFPPGAAGGGGGGGGDCLALILIEDAQLAELAEAFLGLTRGFDVPVGTVVVLSSVSHLGRVGTAAYAADMVRALGRIHGGFGKSVRTVHGFPLLRGGVQDENTVRGLRDIELWLAEVDKSRHCSLPATSDHFIRHFTHNSANPSISGTARLALKLPSSLHSLDMLEELNVKFALQLDPSPITDWSSQSATDPQTESGLCILLAGSSHSSRLIDPLESAHLTVVDSTVPGFRITESSVSAMASDMEEKLSELDPANTVVLVQLLDNSVYQCKHSNGDRSLPKRGRDGNYHAEGELSVVNRDTLRELFSSLQPVFSAAKNFKCILLSPLPRYLWNRCCGDPAHIINSEELGYAANMGTALRELNKSLRNMIFMRKMKGVTMLNSLEALGLIPSADAGSVSDDEGRILALWGDDPVHPTRAAYRELATKIVEKAEQLLEEVSETVIDSGHKKRKTDRRDPWISGSTSVAKRFDARPENAKKHQSRGGKPPHRPYRGRGWWSRGARHGKK
jgi:hypothetical protein